MNKELEIVPLNNGLQLFRMLSIEVDGIQRHMWEDDTTIQPMFAVKEDPTIIDWDAAYTPLSYKYGKIDEEAWLKYGVIQ